jgi:hypothetical protein
MYSASEKYISQIISNDRTFYVRVTFNSSLVLTGATIQNIGLEELTNSTDVLTMGCACSNKITINLINAPTDIDYNNASFTAEIGLLIPDKPTTYTEWVPLGEFYVSDAETTNDFKNLTLTAYDGFYKMTGKFVPTAYETTLQGLYDDFRAQLYNNCGVVLKERTCPDYAVSVPSLDITYKQAAGYIAGCFGEFARFDRNGELEFAWYTDSGIEIPRSLQYMGGFKRTTKHLLVVTSLSTGTKENPIVRGLGSNGTNINFENPYITAEMADDIFARVNNFTYTPCEVKWRGNPAVMAGDIVTVHDKDSYPHTVLIMNRTLKVGGGCNDTIVCKGVSETKAEFSNNFESVGQKIQRVYTTLEQSILDATNAITGNSGGYVVMRDTNVDNKPDEILIMDSEDITQATKVWRWNKEGLGYAEQAAGNAYLGPYRTAITADGKINADFIVTGTLNADLIRVGDEKFGDYISITDGVIRFGNTDDQMSLKLGNVEVDGEKTYQLAFFSGDTRIAYFSNNSFEIENLTEGKIRFQNFGFIPRASGNLSFTKLI